MNEELKKVNAYFRMVNNNVIEPILKSEQGRTSMLLMVFAAIDGFAKLTYPKPHANTRDRFNYYIENFFSADYAQHVNELYKLRCSFTNNALGFASFMNQDHGECHHLEFQCGAHFLYIDGQIFFQDFFDSMMQVMDQLNSNNSAFASVAQRLRWLDEDDETFWYTQDHPDADIQFVRIS